MPNVKYIHARSAEVGWERAGGDSPLGEAFKDVWHRHLIDADPGVWEIRFEPDRELPPHAFDCQTVQWFTSGSVTIAGERPCGSEDVRWGSPGQASGKWKAGSMGARFYLAAIGGRHRNHGEAGAAAWRDDGKVGHHGAGRPHKWNAGLPVEDPNREAAVLEKSLAMAVEGGLDPKIAARVLRAQIEAAKIVQGGLFEQWRKAAKSKFAEAPSLTAILRPEVTRLSRELIVALIGVQDDLDDCLAGRFLKPLPSALARFPRAWRVAVEGTLGAAGPCPPAADGR
jgi:chorismate mutase-like protein